MASIEQIKGSDGSGNANIATIQSTRSPGATTIDVDTVLGINGAGFSGSMGTPHTFTDPVTSEVITVISDATAVDFTGHIDGSNLEIDDIAPGYTDLGSEVGDIVIIRPTTQWSDNVAAVLEASHKDDGSIHATNPEIVTGINDTNGNELLKLTATASAVNELTLANGAAGNAPALSATGGDTNIDLKLKPKGTGAIDLFGAVLKGILYRRQGGSSTVYGTAGTNNYDSSSDKIIIQAGVVASSAGGDVTVTFPVAFSQTPLVIATANSATNASTFAIAINPSTTAFTLRAYTGSTRAAENCAWIAIGPKA